MIPHEPFPGRKGPRCVARTAPRGEVIDLLAQKTNSHHPLGALVSPEVRMDQNLGNTMVFGGNTMVFDGNTMVFWVEIPWFLVEIPRFCWWFLDIFWGNNLPYLSNTYQEQLVFDQFFFLWWKVVFDTSVWWPIAGLQTIAIDRPRSRMQWNNWKNP